MNKRILSLAAQQSVGALAYIVAVVSFLFYAPQFILAEDKATVLIQVAMLLLFVFSAAFTGAMVLGRPVMWYLDGKKKDALSLFLATIGFLFLMTVCAFVALIFFFR